MSVTIKDCTLIKKTEKAIQVEVPKRGSFWIPESQIDDDSELWCSSKIGETGKLVISDWIAEQKDL